MYKIQTKTKLTALDGSPIRRIGVSWRDTLQAVQATAKKMPGSSLSHVLETTAATIASAEGQPMTLADAVADALLGGKGAEDATGSEKLRRWELAVRFRDAEEVELPAEDVVFVKERMAEVFKPGVFGPAVDALEGRTREVEMEMRLMVDAEVLAKNLRKREPTET